MKHVDTGSLRMAVEDAGSGTPLLLVHGLPLNRRMWDEQVRKLSSRCRVISPDLRGFGESDVLETATMDRFADDLNALLDAMNVREPVVLCGLSMGGYVAFAFWRKYADRVAGLVLCDTRSNADSPDVAKGRKETADRVSRQGTDFLSEAMTEKLFSPTTRRDKPEVVQAIQQAMRTAPPQGVSAALLAMAERPDSTELLATISVPTLVLVGEEDAISPVEEMRTIAAAVPHSQFVVIPEAGHMAPCEQPEAVNEALRDFLSGLDD
ncbi:MAG: alpha/beta hydrolase [Planctomycetales bacterium]